MGLPINIEEIKLSEECVFTQTCIVKHKHAVCLSYSMNKKAMLCKECEMKADNWCFVLYYWKHLHPSHLELPPKEQQLYQNTKTDVNHEEEKSNNWYQKSSISLCMISDLQREKKWLLFVPRCRGKCWEHHQSNILFSVAVISCVKTQAADESHHLYGVFEKYHPP